MRTSRRNCHAIIIASNFLFFACSTHEPLLTRIDYLGQEPPGKTATLFAPDIVSTNAMEHSAPAFSPDGMVVLWTVVPDGFSKPSYFLEMSYENKKWSPPHRVSFNDSTADDYYPSFSIDGKTLFFSSRRKLPPGYNQNGDMRIWRVERTQKGWSIPAPLDTTISRGHEFAHSVTSDGTIFFSTGFFSDAENGETGWSIFRARMDDAFAVPYILPYSINSMGYEDGPYVAPDESFLIFESDRPEGMGGTDLYISFKSEPDRWTRPVNMGSAINSTFSERFARMSPDGKFLFFGSSRDEKEGHPGFDIYWIDSSVIDELKTTVISDTPIQTKLGDQLLKSLDDGEWAESEVLLKEWQMAYPTDADAAFNYAIVLKKQEKYADAEQFLTRKARLFQSNERYSLEMASLSIVLDKEKQAALILTPWLLDSAHQWNRLMYMSTSLFDMKKFDASDAYFRKAMDVNMWSFGYYKRAGAYARVGEKDRAFKNLFLAAENGFKEKRHFEEDADLEPLRATPQWQQLIAELE